MNIIINLLLITCNPTAFKMSLLICSDKISTIIRMNFFNLLEQFKNQ